MRQARNRLRTHKEKLNIVHKCLYILLDDRLMETAILKGSIVRHATNYFVHKQLKSIKNPTVADALKNGAEELVQEANLPLKGRDIFLNLPAESQKLTEFVVQEGRRPHTTRVDDTFGSQGR